MPKPELCHHARSQPENAEWPEPVYWAHYCNCLDDAQRREVLAKAREWSGKGSRCVLADHPAQLAGMEEVLGEVGTALAEATNILEKHHRYLDLRMTATRGVDGSVYTAYKRAHDNLGELMGATLEGHDD